jgi:YD repeat-containing protein
MTSETNPESGTTTYTYDTSGPSPCNGGYTANGDLIRVVDASGTNTCNYYDALHRVTDVGVVATNGSTCKRFRYDNTSGVLGTIPSGISVSNVLGRLTEAETDTCASWPITQSSIVTDEWFSYTPRGQTGDAWESTLHSGGYYHSAATYWPNGAPNLLTNSPSGYYMSYGLDAVGRPYSTTDSGGLHPLTSTSYSPAGLPTQLSFGYTGDSDNYSYDPTGRMTQYKFNVNGQSVVGNLTWNPNGTLGTLGVTDAFNSSDTQNCTYGHDDLVRIASANCESI